MRILYFTREPHPTFRADIAVLFGKYLPRHGIYSDLVCQALEPGATAMPWAAGEAIVCRRSGNRVVDAVLPLFHTLKVLWGMRKAPYDAYQVRDNPLQALLALGFARWRGVPFYYWMSFPIPESSLFLAKDGPRRLGWPRYLFALAKGHAGTAILYRLVMPRADHVFVQSEQMVEDVAAEGIPRARMTPVPMGVDLEAASPDSIAPSDDVRLAGKRVVVYLGTLERARRIDLLFEMVALLRPRMPDILLVLAGDTHDKGHRDTLRRRMEELAVADAVVWIGWLPTTEAWRYLRAAEVGLSPFPRSPLLDSCSPTKAIEYMAFGLPVLVNDQPDQARVVAESGAGVCVPLSAVAFADSLFGLLSTPGESHKYHGRGRNYVSSRRSYEVISKSLTGTYRNLLPCTALAQAGSRRIQGDCK